MTLSESPILQHADVITRVGQIADDLGISVFAVGGIVRDSILGRPTDEIDFVSLGSGSGIKLARGVSELRKAGMMHEYHKFGTAGVRLMADSGPVVLEFVGARKESYRRDSRNPIVEEGTIDEDLTRRDFTVNAIAVRLNEEGFGEVLDPFRGRIDIERGILQTPLPPIRTFDDDPLRIVRAARFAAQLGFDIESETLAAMAATADRLEIVSQERITEEVRKIVCSQSPSTGFRILFTTGLLAGILPELADLAGVETVDGHRHKDNFYHTLQVVQNLVEGQVPLDHPVEWLRWSALLHDIGKSRTKRFSPGTGWSFHGHEDLSARMIPPVFRRLKLPTDERMEYVQKIVRLHHRPVSLVDESVTDSAVRRLIFDAGEEIEDLMRMVRADITSKNPSRVRKYLDNFDLVEEKMIEVEEKDRLRAFQPPLDGKEIMEVIGLTEGVAVGIIKENIREAILDGDIPNEHDAALELMMRIKDDALRRAALFHSFIRSLTRAESRVIGSIKEIIFFGTIPDDEEKARRFLDEEKVRLLSPPDEAD